MSNIKKIADELSKVAESSDTEKLADAKMGIEWNAGAIIDYLPEVFGS